jgi:16S rRNA (cytosine1402-N4)-methyltransferase
LRIEHGSFSQLQTILQRCVPGRCVDGILVDLGVSSPQLDDPARGFSFMHDGPLDMRMDPGTGESAADWLNRAEEKEIAQVLLRLGEEKSARRIARAISERRREKPIDTTGELAELVAAVVPRQRGGKHPATRSFQAIRMHVNNELSELDALLGQSIDALRSGGRLCAISFHSLEDRRVKRFLRDNSRVDPALARLPLVPESARPRLRLPCRAIRPGAAELAANPRARSATLRVGERL